MASFRSVILHPLTALSALLGFLGLLLWGGITWFVQIYRSHPANSSLDFEIAKTLLQIGVVSVAAALVSLMVKYYERNVEKQQKDRDADQLRERNREELLKATMNRVTSSYNNCKRARRDMRALGLVRNKEPVLVEAKQWDECMARVNDAQLEFETIITDLEADLGTYVPAEFFQVNLTRMEKYLGRMIREYETARPRMEAGNNIPLSDLKFLSDFLGEVRDSQFKSEFALSRGAVRGALLHLTTTTRR